MIRVQLIQHILYYHRFLLCFGGRFFYVKYGLYIIIWVQACLVLFYSQHKCDVWGLLFTVRPHLEAAVRVRVRVRE